MPNVTLLSQMSVTCGKKLLETMYSTFLPWIVYLLDLLYFKMSCVYCCHLMCICCTMCVQLFTLDAGLLAISQYSEGPATGHLDTGFSRFPCVYKQMLRWFPRFQVATTCFSCSPPDLNSLVTNFVFCIHVK